MVPNMNTLGLKMQDNFDLQAIERPFFFLWIIYVIHVFFFVMFSCASVY